MAVDAGQDARPARISPRMINVSLRQLPRLLAALLLTVTGGCALFEMPDWARQPPAGPVRVATELPPLVTNRLLLGPDSNVVGELQVIRARHEDTFLDIARAYDLGYDELVDANPGVDPWLPGAGTRVLLPTRYVLPDGPREGIVLNVGTKRLFYFPKATPGAPREVITHPVGIGREGWSTPLGTTKIVAKTKDPVWTVPASIRREHAAAGNPLPARVPPGPDNPLGAYAMRLGFDSYLIHGTNKPDGIGMRVSHGCIQLFPEDIETLFGAVPVGTTVRIVNQPLLLGWQDGNLWLEAHPALEEDKRNLRAELDRRLTGALKGRAADAPGLDPALVERTVAASRGFPVPLLEPASDADSLVARARPTVNVLAATDSAPEPVAADCAAGC